MTEDEIMEILNELRSQMKEISLKVNKISKQMGLDLEIKEIELQSNEYYEREIPEIDELDRRRIKKKGKWVKETY